MWENQAHFLVRFFRCERVATLPFIQNFQGMGGSSRARGIVIRIVQGEKSTYSIVSTHLSRSRTRCTQAAWLALWIVPCDTPHSSSLAVLRLCRVQSTIVLVEYMLKCTAVRLYVYHTIMHSSYSLSASSYVLFIVGMPTMNT